MPTAETRCPGRETAMPVVAKHLVLDTPITPPFPEASSGSSSAWAASGAPSASSGRRPGSTRPPSATRAGSRRTRPTRRRARAAPATPRPCSPCTTLRGRATRRCCGSSGRATTRPRGCGRATTSARSTARRSTGTTSASGMPRSRRARCSRRELLAGGLRRDHDRDRRGRAVLLRRAVPPAVPRGEPERLLRARRHGRRLPDASRADRKPQ